MQNSKLKNASKAVIFILIFVLLMNCLTHIFVPKWLDSNAETSSAVHFYEQKKDTLEVLFLGSSQITQCVDSVALYEKYGILSYDLGGSHNTLLANYYWMLDALDRHKSIKTVVVDMSLVFNKDTEQDVNYRKNFDYMKWSKYKFNAIRDYHDKIPTPLTESDSLLEMEASFLFPITRFHSRWDSLEEKDFRMDKYDVYNIEGYTPASNRWIPNMSYESFVIDNDSRDDDYSLFNEVQTSYLNKIIDECKSRNINCVLIKTPKASWNKTAHNYVEKLAKEKGIDFLEYTCDEALKKMNFNLEQDMRDRDHLNARGALKLVDLLGEYLIQHEDYTDYRDKNGIDSKTLKRYHKALNHCLLSTSLTPVEFFKELKNDKYTVVIQSSADISEYWNGELQKALENNGFTIDISKMKKTNYISVVKNSKLEFEEKDAEAIEKNFKIIPSVKCKTVTDFKDTTTKYGHQSELEYSKNGLRITVFDYDSAFLVTQATIYEENGQLKLFVENSE